MRTAHIKPETLTFCEIMLKDAIDNKIDWICTLSVETAKELLKIINILTHEK